MIYNLFTIVYISYIIKTTSLKFKIIISTLTVAGLFKDIRPFSGPFSTTFLRRRRHRVSTGNANMHWGSTRRYFTK